MPYRSNDPERRAPVGSRACAVRLFAVYYLKQFRDTTKRSSMRPLGFASGETFLLNKLGGFGEIECEQFFIDDI